VRVPFVFSYFHATRSYLERHGKPVAFYSDKAGVFRVNAKTPKAFLGLEPSLFRALCTLRASRHKPDHQVNASVDQARSAIHRSAEKTETWLRSDRNSVSGPSRKQCS